MGGGWNWLRIVSSGGLLYYQCLNLWVLLPESKIDLREMCCEVDGTGSGLCPMAGFGISGVEPSGSATVMLVMFSISTVNVHYTRNQF
jgi:hypothetical protein